MPAQKARPKKAITKTKRKPAAKKPAGKKPARKPAAKAPAKKIKTPRNLAGRVTHYFPKVSAAAIKLITTLAVGETVRFKGHTTDFTQTITSMQIDRVPVSKAGKNDEIGILVNSRVRRRDKVEKA